jgi:hypothetical protein
MSPILTQIQFSSSTEYQDLNEYHSYVIMFPCRYGDQDQFFVAKLQAERITDLNQTGELPGNELKRYWADETSAINYLKEKHPNLVVNIINHLA